MVPDTSRTSVPGSTLSSLPTMTTLPAAKATSVTASSFWEGSITRPPRRTKSKGIAISECDIEGSGGSTSVAQDQALPRLAHQIEHALDDARAITTPLDRARVGSTNGENAAHASIFLGNERVSSLSLSLSLSLSRPRRGPESGSARAEDAECKQVSRHQAEN